ncbi:MAG TPA: arginine--tRNA ligase [Clostridia bacterium]|jgi:arginyl-tRNA synthetase|nr:arginine--tRNA ligase [Clostridiaceae bacterium]HOF26591.1 arginine--tRNA ligase [Clostridia bacterium]HOM34284.1 arginine--tRNA ligase [Clostridia bacterium]HOR89411.1 arginine--tRNA ligase [Clostridia bacterium]HOT70780.1 arginine--tRNA ligase [Clostridia bacterium]
MKDIKTKIAKKLAGSIEQLSWTEIMDNLEYPPEPHMGDLALPCFKLSRVMRKSPMAIADSLVDSLDIDVVERCESKSGYLNIFINREYLVNNVLKTIVEKKEETGKSNEYAGKTVCLDYSAPNIAKPFHIGHLRSTVIGHAIRRLHEFRGYKCVGINHLGDWGTQFGKLIVAYKKWSSKKAVEEKGTEELVRIYVKFHEEAEKDPSLNDLARQWFARLENKDEDAMELWKWFKKISLIDIEKTYKVLDITFDSYAGESFYYDKTQPVVERLKERNLLIESDGAMIVNLEEYNMPPCLIVKSDGASLYASRDIAAAIYRKETYDFDKCIYVTATAQDLHFRQWFKVVELMGYEWAKNLIHVGFGMVSMGGAKLATREGNIVYLDDLFSEASKRVLDIINEKNPDMEDKEQKAQDIGVGAVVFSDLSNNRIKDIDFSWEEALNFDGSTGPYVQYTYARACSVLRKSELSEKDINMKDIKPEHMTNDDEFTLLKTLSLFNEKIDQALRDLEPSCISRYLIDVCMDFNKFYNAHSILGAEDNKKFRILLTAAVKYVLANGLFIIGLKRTERV